ncbi:MAG: hypothetical protein ACLR8Y_11605 [Alistipes indistinctus]
MKTRPAPKSKWRPARSMQYGTSGETGSGGLAIRLEPAEPGKR